jgi:hypothetical protein
MGGGGFMIGAWIGGLHYWPWILALTVTAFVMPFFAFRRMNVVLMDAIAKSPKLMMLPQRGALVVINQGGQADVAVEGLFIQEFIGDGNTLPLPLVWQKTDAYRLRLMRGESGILYCIDTRMTDDSNISEVIIRFHNPNGDNTRSFHKFTKGFTGRIGYVIVVPNAEPSSIGDDLTRRFNIVIRNNGLADLEPRSANQELVDRLERGRGCPSLPCSVSGVGGGSK